MANTDLQQAVNEIGGGIIILPDWSLWLLAFVVFVAGTFIKSYISSRSKTYATKQDLDEITRQLRHTTEITEEIKADIGKGVWLQQQVWEFKKQIYTELLENLFELQSTLFDLIRLGHKELNENEEKYRQGLEEKRAKTKEAIRLVAGNAAMILSEDKFDVLHNMYGDLMRVPDLSNAHDFDDADAELAQVEGAYEYFVEAGKKDLGIQIEKNT